VTSAAPTRGSLQIPGTQKPNAAAAGANGAVDAPSTEKADGVAAGERDPNAVADDLYEAMVRLERGMCGSICKERPRARGSRLRLDVSVALAMQMKATRRTRPLSGTYTRSRLTTRKSRYAAGSAGQRYSFLQPLRLLRGLVWTTVIGSRTLSGAALSLSTRCWKSTTSTTIAATQTWTLTCGPRR